MNKVILMGRLTRDPEVRYSQGLSRQRFAGIAWRLTGPIAARANRKLTLSISWLLAAAVSSLANISEKV